MQCGTTSIFTRANQPQIYQKSGTQINISINVQLSIVNES